MEDKNLFFYASNANSELFQSFEYISEKQNTLIDTADKTKKVAYNSLNEEFFLHRQGAIKFVWIKKSDVVSSNQNDIITPAYYTAKSSILGRKEDELRKEIITMQLIGEMVKEKGGNIEHLAVGVEILIDEKDWIEGDFTVKVPYAYLDFDDLLSSAKFNVVQIFNFASQFLDGINNLHSAGFAYGDMKPENILIYVKNMNPLIKVDPKFINWNDALLKISDFGKTVQIDPKGQAPYVGNTRYVSPEGILTQAADVYSSGLLLIRIFENEFLDEDTKSLLDVPYNAKDSIANKKLVGVEKYLVEHKAFLASNPGSWKGLVRRYRINSLSSKEKMAQKEAIYEYINVLSEKLINKYREHKETIGQLIYLLQRMTNENPEIRPNAQECFVQFQECFDQLKNID